MSAKKKPPTWANVIGILGICFGALGMIGGGYEIMMPLMIDIQGKMIESMKESTKSVPERSNYDKGETAQLEPDPEAMLQTMQDLMATPPWYSTFAFTNGGLQLLFGALLILSSIFLLVIKQGATTFFLTVAVLSAIRNITALSVGISMSSLMAFWSIVSGAGGFLIDLILIIVVMVSDRSIYKQPQA
jgi:hypothetical protein